MLVSRTVECCDEVCLVSRSRGRTGSRSTLNSGTTALVCKSDGTARATLGLSAGRAGGPGRSARFQIAWDGQGSADSPRWSKVSLPCSTTTEGRCTPLGLFHRRRPQFRIRGPFHYKSVILCTLLFCRDVTLEKGARLRTARALWGSKPSTNGAPTFNGSSSGPLDTAVATCEY